MYCEICNNRIKSNYNGIPKNILLPVCNPECLVKYFVIKNNCLYQQKQKTKTDIQVQIINQTNNFKSNIERDVADFLNKYNIKFLYENIVIYDAKYTYIPDFYLPDYKCFLEVKSGHKQRLIKVKHFVNMGIPIYVAWL